MRRMLALIVVVAAACSAENHCCSFPCQNRGVCSTKGFNDYECDCSGLEFYGRNCEIPTFMKRIVLWLKPNPELVHHILTHYKWFWNIINSISFTKDIVMKLVYLTRAAVVDSPSTYTSEHGYITMEAATNFSYFARCLPPVPHSCPTPMGTAGRKELPSIEALLPIFVRDQFRPDPMGTSVMFTFFAQHFTHQFFKTDLNKGPGFQWGGHGVDVSHIYGKDKHSENLLRSFKNGKMKTQIIDGEEWPPLVKDSPVKMLYPPNISEDRKFALGHEFFSLLPGLLVYGVIWVREHNRVCDILKVDHPEWDDEQLFQTAKLIIIGETINIVVEDYVQHLSHYHFRLMFKPELLFGAAFQYQNRIAVEFNHLYHWHPLMPDEFNISGTVYPIKDFIFHPELVQKHGMHDFVDSMSKQRAGQMSHHNHGKYTLKIAKETILHGRQLRFQSFNQYRKRFHLDPYKSFQELTGEKKLARELEELYGDIDAVEFYVGLLVEKRRPWSVFGGTILEMGGPYSVKGLLANPICSPRYWRPSTFGGQKGFDIIKTATVQKLFCQNIKGDCPLVTFKVPDWSSEEEAEHFRKSRNEL